MVHGWGPKGADEESRNPLWPPHPEPVLLTDTQRPLELRGTHT